MLRLRRVRSLLRRITGDDYLVSTEFGYIVVTDYNAVLTLFRHRSPRTGRRATT